MPDLPDFDQRDWRATAEELYQRERDVRDNPAWFAREAWWVLKTILTEGGDIEDMEEAYLRTISELEDEIFDKDQTIKDLEDELAELEDKLKEKDNAGYETNQMPHGA
jgi:hypothetical protein